MRTAATTTMGIIPACAGSTCPSALVMQIRRDHPRMCGEHLGFGRPLASPLGSSPHVRGAPAVECGSRGEARDHPRMCGEHAADVIKAAGLEGSSPHVRGAQRRVFLDAFAHGIIPACAESTSGGYRGWWLRWDHPRMCGEHPKWLPITSRLMGSSPHVRGAHGSSAGHQRGSGIIPACAGSTQRCPLRAPLSGDHPRMCGEHSHDFDFGDSNPGSSPHVRGARTGGRHDHSHPGIIPACAGSTRSAWPMRPASRDHPRMCGEHLVSWKPPVESAGSSPHVRGAQLSDVSDGAKDGIIPACAGSTGQGS